MVLDMIIRCFLVVGNVVCMFLVNFLWVSWIGKDWNIVFEVRFGFV